VLMLMCVHARVARGACVRARAKLRVRWCVDSFILVRGECVRG
jgi:hypothetical protein